MTLKDVVCKGRRQAGGGVFMFALERVGRGVRFRKGARGMNCRMWACLVTGILPVTAWANSVPQIVTMPAVSSNPLIADDTTVYTVTTTIRDADGYDDIRCIRTLFNVTEGKNAGWDSSYGRGYLAWGAADSDIAQYGGVWVFADADGGGRWAYRTDDWGGTTYITPLSCTMSTSGSATGGEGSRTVTWSFCVKPAWAFSPLTNDADVWVADYAVNTSWRDNPDEFDVVDSPCVTYAATPHAPIVSNATSTTLDVVINPADSDTELFAIKMSPDIQGNAYVQADGSIGAMPVWRTKADWGTTTVVGLMWDTSYSFSVRARGAGGGECPSPYGPATVGTTAGKVSVIDCRQGTSFNPGVRGQCPYRSISESTYGTLWDLTIGSGARGLAGGLDADTYDWRDIDSGANWGLRGGYFTTLQFLQYARDHQAFAILTANMFGGGYKDPTDGTFICQTDNPEGLAADWVRYCNIILQNYRQGDEGNLTGEDLRVYNSISNWHDRPKLLDPQEAPTPTVQYWEIGNEPRVGGFPGFLSNHYLSETGYRNRYKSMAQAMRAVDPTIKIGCCLTNPDENGGGPWLEALAADSAIPLDFVGYHPYYSNIKWAWGDADDMTDALRQFKSYLDSKVDAIHAIMGRYGRSDYELLATEWNPMNWDAPSNQQRSMAQALGVVEGVFTFAEEGVTAATFWEQPQNKRSAKDVYYALVDYMGDTLLSNVQQLGLDPDNVNWRIYASKDSNDSDALAIWGLNFNEDEQVELDIEIGGPCYVQTATLKRYGVPGDDASGGDTSLMTSSGMAWDQEDVTAAFRHNRYHLVLEDAEVTLLVLNTTPAAPVDFDHDGDVDLEDFGRFQVCISGENLPQDDPECFYARLDGDADVDAADLSKFMNCLDSPGIRADPGCAD